MKESMGESLHKLMHSYRGKMREAAAQAGLSIPVSHIRSLKCIKNIKNCSARDIAERLSLDKSQVTRVLKELNCANYVKKIRSPDNHRSQLLSLTKTGDELLESLMILDQAAIKSMTQNLSEQQIENFIHIAQTMTNNLHPSPSPNEIKDPLMSRPQPRELTVIRKSSITTNMLRVTLGGENIHTIPENQTGGYVKLIFAREEQKPLIRTYTIRHQRADEIDIDFVLHEDGGPASSWAKQAQPNDTILVGGPGPKKTIEESSDWKILIGDMTALPAISVNLEELSQDAKGYALLEVMSEDDIQPLKHPAGIELKWIVNPHSGENSNVLLDQIQSLAWPQGSVSVWAACEFSGMRALRSFFKNNTNVEKENLYISSYWKLGSNEDQHKEVKRIDTEEAL
ncbi:SIP domain-containing protein [Marinomonas sp. M1K-6]|uniref:SIP domain-containing protein n=1 Tax=Marinomonas profundi TaxID=2726122 RepID=A0A847R357_9GAMM|nr:SIP domain-containing protein [Marinomonas profundi]NLQ16356.1 SIP domain-containing protein [Marinomonas profundi]UDV03069.1 SIP domain-containing protein [Marinomonas profundi]